MSKKRRIDHEGPIQRAICSYLTTALDPAVGYWFSVPNENDGSPSMNARLNSQGRKAGVADLCVVSHGRAYFIEVKAEGGRQGDTQKAFEAAIRLVGAEYGIARSVDDVAELMAVWGIPARARVGVLR